MSGVTGQLRGLRAEMRLAALPAAVLTAVITLVAAGRSVQVYLGGWGRQNVPADWVSLTEPAGALRAAGWNMGSLSGLLLTTVLAALLFARPVEEGSWSLVRLGERRVGCLVVRKLLALVLCGGIASAVVAVALWGAGQVVLEVEPYPPEARVPLPSPAPVPWQEAWACAARGLAAMAVYGALSCCAAGLLPGMFTSMGVAAGPVLVSAPLVLTPQREWSPAYWIAAWLDVPDSAQWTAYFWSSAPSDVASDGLWPWGAALAAVALVVGRVGLGAERRLTPAD